MAEQVVTVRCPTCHGKGTRGNRECGLCLGAKVIDVIEGDDDDD